MSEWLPAHLETPHAHTSHPFILTFQYYNVEGEMWLKLASRADLKGTMGTESCRWPLGY